MLASLWIIPVMQAQIGKVGINTNTPAAMLHVKDSSVLFTGIVPLPFPPGNPPVSGAGTRMMWYADKGAFRMGNVDGTQWNKDSIGTYSIGVGQNVKAKGLWSIAMGYQTTALGWASAAIGHTNTASGNISIALGAETIASGIQSTAMGTNTEANGEFSTAMGGNSIASGYVSTAIGHTTIASGYASMAMGYFTTASGSNSVAMGSNTLAGGDFSTSMGVGTIANGTYSTTMGFNTKVVGNIATSMGFNTIARPYASLVLGRYNDTTSINSTSWDVLDPVFVIGNGSSNTARTNAFTVLKSGKTGINHASPFAMLHVVKDAVSGGPFNTNAAAIFEGDQGSFIQLSNDNVVQTGILSGNEVTSIRSALIFSQDSSILLRTGGNTTRVTIGNTGDMGVGDNTPNARLHVSGGTGGSMYHADADVIVEDNTQAYLQFSTLSNSASGLLSGNAVTSIRSALLFMADSTVQVRSGGNTIRFTIDQSGNTNTTGEIHRTPTGNANMVPICYGSVDANGTILSGSGNYSVTTTPPGYYEITITGESYTNSGYTTSANPVSSNPRMLSIGNNGGKLAVRTFTSAGALVDTIFHFVVYKN